MASETAIISFSDVHFSYPESEGAVFSGFSGNLPGGFVSLVGPNGSGKSTLMLLAAGRLLPQAGVVSLLGRDTRLFIDEDERNAYASFVYQNMEFDSQDPMGDLLEQVYSAGKHPLKGDAFYREALEAFDLGSLLGRSLNTLSKGEMQRTLLAFSALYGSRSVFMDESVFAMENQQKERAMDFFRSYQERTGITVYVSLHELELTRKYAQRTILFKPDRTMEIGTPEEVLTREGLEAAYGVPAAMLKDKEQLDRRRLEEEADFLKGR